MSFTRRSALKLGLAGLAGAGALPWRAAAEGMGDRYAAEGGDIVVQPVQHASFVLTAPGGAVLYNDPVGGAALYAGEPKPDLILITHQHGDHYDPETLSALAGDTTRLVVNPAVFGMLPDGLKAKARSLANGDSASVDGIAIDAVPAYNTTEDRLKFHPKGRDNGYVLTIAGKRVYIAGDTEDIPEMRALKNVDIAFVPMNLPYTMSTDQAASAVAEFAPAVVYPYHYRGSDPQLFAGKLASMGSKTTVVLGRWYG